MNALEMAHYIASTMYTDEFCSICGCAIAVDAPKTSVWTDVRGNKMLRSAHTECSAKQAPERAYAMDFSINHH